MEPNEYRMPEKWKDLKIELKRTWNKLTDDELERSKGDIKIIEGLIQRKYGELQTINSQKIAAIFKSVAESKEDTTTIDQEDLKNIRDFE